MRWLTCAALFGAAVLSLAGCTADGPGVTSGSAPSALSVASSQPSMSASEAPTTSPYHLDIPTDDRHELFRWVSGRHGGTVLFDDVRAGRRYRIEGACIYGYADRLTYRVLDARATRLKDRMITKGTIRCDGQPHVQVITAAVSTPVELLPGAMGDKTVAYLRLLPDRS